MSRLPAPVSASWEWQMRAACRGLDSTVFFRPERERGLAAEERDSIAKTICCACPVIEACRRHALTVREPYGVWGGLTAAERKELLLELKKGAVSWETLRQP
ncbi:WhiB family redox-sensing transcriptional regulator [Kibdelosporangium phytohabitans]|nr:WhiB family redox-sensing transcriptional regulator [Kibdelosporangium phytohabitans]